MEKTAWLTDMHNKPKLRRYITFKTILLVYNHVKQYQGFPQSIKASWYHKALNIYPDASVIPMMFFQMP